MRSNKIKLLLMMFVCCGFIYPHGKLKEKERMALISGGEYIPFFKERQSDKQVLQPFYMDKYPVTNDEYLKFVKANPKWRRSNIKRIFADQSYLKNWKSDLEPGNNVKLNSPVTNISWFAAKAYAAWIGKRLPTIAEWEYVAAASEKKANGLSDNEFKQRILEWYSKPTPAIIPEVKENKPNFWKVFDMHGLVWEWVDDFNSILLSGESRTGSEIGKNLFCGGGSVRTIDPGDYAAYMRYALRSSLSANYTVYNLGFRCVKDISQNKIAGR